MSTRELIFEYKTRGARAAAKADSRVRQSVQRTGRVADRNAGSVERWMSRNRQAINRVALAAGGAVAAILSATPRLRAELSVARVAFTLFANVITEDVLPESESLTETLLDLVDAYEDLPGPVRTATSNLIVFGGAALLASVAVAPFAGALILAIGVFKALSDAVSPTVGLMGALAVVSLALLIAVGPIAAVIMLVVGALVILAGWIWRNKDAILDFIQNGINYLVDRFTKAKEWLVLLGRLIYLAVAQKFNDLKERLQLIGMVIRNVVSNKFEELKERVLTLLSIGRQLADKGKEWIGGLIQGVKDRASDLVSAFRDMATQAANAFRAAFNRIIPDRVSIPRVSISIPNILGGGSVGVGGGSIDIPQLNTGGRIARDGLAMLHAGERVVPAAQVRERGPQPVGGGTTVQEVNITVHAMGDDARMTGRNIAQEFQRELEDRGA